MMTFQPLTAGLHRVMRSTGYAYIVFCPTVPQVIIFLNSKSVIYLLLDELSVISRVTKVLV